MSYQKETYPKSPNLGAQMNEMEFKLGWKVFGGWTALESGLDGPNSYTLGLSTAFQMLVVSTKMGAARDAWGFPRGCRV